MPLKTTFDQTTTKVSHFADFSYLAPHVLMSVLVNIFASSYHRVMMYVPIDSVSSHDASRYVGCAVKISNKGVLSEL